jgi:hypothetical protein
MARALCTYLRCSHFHVWLLISGLGDMDGSGYDQGAHGGLLSTDYQGFPRGWVGKRTIPLCWACYSNHRRTYFLSHGDTGLGAIAVKRPGSSCSVAHLLQDI